MKEKDRLNLLFDQARSENPIVEQSKIENLLRSGKKVSATKIKLGKAGRGLFNPLNLIIMISTIAIIVTSLFLVFNQSPEVSQESHLAQIPTETPAGRTQKQSIAKEVIPAKAGTSSQISVILNNELPGLENIAELNDTLIIGDVLHLTQEELTRLGFQFTDDGFLYLNETEYGFSNFYCVSEHPDKERDSRGFGLSKKPLTPYIEATKFESYPSMSTGVNGEALHEFEIEARRVTYYGAKYLDDLMVPVFFPGRWFQDDLTCDRLIWFKNPGSEFFDLLPEEKIAESRKRIEYVQQLRKLPGNEEKNLVNYNFDNLGINKVDPIILGGEYLNKLGFRIIADRIVYGYKNHSRLVALSLSTKGNNFRGIIDADTVELKRVDSVKVPLLGVTHPDGNHPISISSRFYSELPDTLDFLSNIQDVSIPIRFESDSLPGIVLNSIFWFYPTEAFFSSLPDSIGGPMAIEYNINVLPKLQGSNAGSKAKIVISGVLADARVYKTEPQEAVACEYFPSFCEGLPGLDDVNVYPNPATEMINVEIIISRSKSINFRIFDISGRLMIDDVETREYQDAGQYKQQIDISSLTNGFYLLVLTDDEGARMTRRIVIN